MGLTTTVTSTGQKVIGEHLKRVDRLPRELRPVTEARNKKILKARQRYPAKLPNQRYRRTNRLRNAQTVKPVQSTPFEVSAITFSTGAKGKSGLYDFYVLGDTTTNPKQASIHVGRWKPISRIAETQGKSYLRDVRKVVKKVVK